MLTHPRVLALSIALATAPCRAQEEGFEYPKTKLGERTRALVTALNDGSSEILLAFSRAHRSDKSIAAVSHERMKQALQQIKQSVGKVTPRSIVTDRPRELVILVELGEGGAWANLRAVAADETDAKLSGFTVVPTAGPAREPIEFGDWQSLRDLLEQARKASKAPAIAAAVVAGDEIVAIEAVGERVQGGGAPVTVDDRFHIGSVTKSMTATVLGALVDAGTLSFESKIGEFVEAPHADWVDVTVAHLLHHRSGVSTYTSIDQNGLAKLESYPGTPRQKRAAFVAELLAEPPEAEPGSEFRYSNAGYSVLAHLAEQASDTPWEELVRTHVFGPAEMAHAGFGWPATDERPDQPRGHRPGGQPQPLDDDYVVSHVLAPAGDIHCSIGDLARYARMHLRGLAEQPGAIRPATYRRLHAAPHGDYAAGWMLRVAGPCHWHNGSAGTFYALVALYPEQGRAVVFVTNTASALATEVAWAVADAIEQREFGGKPKNRKAPR